MMGGIMQAIQQQVFQMSSIGLSSGDLVGRKITEISIGNPSAPGKSQSNSSKSSQSPPEWIVALSITMKLPLFKYPSLTACIINTKKFVESFVAGEMLNLTGAFRSSKPNKPMTL
jgi:hypothetical protein